MSNTGDVAVQDEPPVIEPYKVLGLNRQATADQIKSAYRKAALKNHPDKVPDSQKGAAHIKFQSIAFAYAVLSDPRRRNRYDATGSTAESIIDSDGFDWSDFYREQFKDTVSADAIKKFAERYKGSEEEKDDLLIAYEESQGDMDKVYEKVMLSHAVDDDNRLRNIIDEAIKDGNVTSFPAYTKESKKKRSARLKASRAEEAEAERYAKELNVHDKLFGRKKKNETKASSEDGLAALIQRRQQDRSANLLDHLAEKYGATGARGKKGKKRQVEEEPSEEAFREAAAKLKKGVSGGGGARSSSKSRRSRN